MNFTSVTNKNWVLKEYNPQHSLKISEEFSLNEIVSKLISIRNIDFKDISSFLNPQIKNLMPNPNTLNDMDKAIKKITEVIINKKIIGVFGDYDVDGATSTAILVNYFKKIKQQVCIYIPDRKTEGYGPNLKGFKKLIDEGSEIIITVDCGTSSYEPINYAKKNDISTIVLDHHQADVKLPDALAIINPNRIDDKSNLNYLCAAGVSLMFLVALNTKLRSLSWFKNNLIDEPDIFNSLDLVCLGTVCDVVPLKGLNRAIVSQGLKVLKKRKNLGLKTLYDLCGIVSEPSTYHLGYIIGPRINAGGRVGKSSHGANLLTSDNPQTTFELAKDLNNYNEERKIIETKALLVAEEEAKKNLNSSVLILEADNWHEGIIGIVASRIKDKYGKPTVIISTTGKIGKGSARSIYGFDIGASILAAKQNNIVLNGGGHKMAGGFTIKVEKINELKKFFIDKFKKLNIDSNKVNNLYVDSIISPTALNEEFYEDILKLAPFGSGNQEPKFIIEKLKVLNIKILSKKHIKVILNTNYGKTIKAIAFNAIGTNLEFYLSKNYKKNINIVGKIISNEWNGKKTIEFIIDDLSISKN